MGTKGRRPVNARHRSGTQIIRRAQLAPGTAHGGDKRIRKHESEFKGHARIFPDLFSGPDMEDSAQRLRSTLSISLPRLLTQMSLQRHKCIAADL